MYKFPKNVIYSPVTNDQIQEVYKFNNVMFKDGYLRPVREGGTHVRNLSEKEKDNIEGKLAEFSVYNFLIKHGVSINKKPSIWIGGKDDYDKGFDLVASIHGKYMNIEVKSSTLNAGGLYLEYERWRINSNNYLIDNDNKNPQNTPDIFFMVDVGFYRNKLKTFITGVLLKQDLTKCVKDGASLFTRYLPTAHDRYDKKSNTEKHLKIDAPNYVFPFKNAYVNYGVVRDESQMNKLMYLRPVKKGLRSWEKLYFNIHK